MTGKSTLLKLIFILILCLIHVSAFAQADLVYGGLLGTGFARTPHIVSLTAFGAVANDTIDDSYALIKASK